MTSIRVVFDGKTFVPQQPVALRPESRAVVFFDNSDQPAGTTLEDAMREYYQTGSDDDDADWGRVTESELRRAWDED